MFRSLLTFALLAGAGYLLWRALQPRPVAAPPEYDWDEVDAASDDSFPASDPPSFTPVTGAKR
jgi:hypothetical protein